MHSHDIHFLPRLPNDEVPTVPVSIRPSHDVEIPVLCFVGGVQSFVQDQLKIPEKSFGNHTSNQTMQDFLGMLPVLSRMEDTCVEMIDAATNGRNPETLKVKRTAKGQVSKQNASMVDSKSLDIIEWLEGHSLNVLKSLHVDVIIPGEEVLLS